MAERAIFFGAPPVLLGLLWWLTAREPQKKNSTDAPTTGEPFRKALANVTRLRYVWLMGFFLLTYWGLHMGFGGYLPLYLRDIGWEPAMADIAMTVFMAIGVLGVIPLVLYSDKIGSRKTVIIFSILVISLAVGLIPLVNTTGVWILLAFGGLVRSGVAALANTMIFEIKVVGGTYGGTAIGLTNSLGMLGAFISPPLGNSLTIFNADMPLFFWAFLGAAGITLILLVKEIRSKPEITVSSEEV